MLNLSFLRRFFLRDLLVSALFSFFSFLFIYLFSNVLVVDYLYLVAVFVLCFFCSFLVLLLKDSLVGFLFLLFYSLISMGFNEFGVVGYNKVVVFLLFALVFEVVFLLLKLEIDNVPLDVVLGVLFGVVMIPIGSYFLLASDLLIFEVDIVSLLGNLIVVTLFFGGLGAFLGIFLWRRVKVSRLFLKISYGF
jgi:hypothetical protein